MCKHVCNASYITVTAMSWKKCITISIWTIPVFLQAPSNLPVSRQPKAQQTQTASSQKSRWSSKMLDCCQDKHICTPKTVIIWRWISYMGGEVEHNLLSDQCPLSARFVWSLFDSNIGLPPCKDTRWMFLSASAPGGIGDATCKYETKI